GSTSNVPRGAWSLSPATALPAGELGEERIGAALRLEAGDAHVARGDGRLAGQRVDEAADRREQRRPVPAGQVDAPDGTLEQDVAGEDDLLVGDRERDVPGRVA